ncbi:hypothetical protein Dimus_007475 [Dionaea muscipula]
MSHYKKKEVTRSIVRGVDIEFDSERLASILGIPGNNGICEYIKEVWEESKYTKPLEITRKFANDNTIMEARRVRSIEMKPFQRTEWRSSVVRAFQLHRRIQQTSRKNQKRRSRPSGLSSHILDSVMKQVAVDFERARANEIQEDLERARVENA